MSSEILRTYKGENIPCTSPQAFLIGFTLRKWLLKKSFLTSLLNFLMYQLIIKHLFDICNCSKHMNIIKSSYGIIHKTEAKSMWWNFSITKKIYKCWMDWLSGAIYVSVRGWLPIAPDLAFKHSFRKMVWKFCTLKFRILIKYQNSDILGYQGWDVH